MNVKIIETNKCVFEDKELPTVNTFKQIEQFSKTIAIKDWQFLCRRKEFLDAVSDGDYNKVKAIAKDTLVIR